MFPGISVMIYGGKTRISHELLEPRAGLQSRVMMEYLSPRLVPKARSIPANRAFLTISYSLMEGQLAHGKFVRSISEQAYMKAGRQLPPPGSMDNSQSTGTSLQSIFLNTFFSKAVPLCKYPPSGSSSLGVCTA